MAAGSEKAGLRVNSQVSDDNVGALINSLNAGDWKNARRSGSGVATSNDGIVLHDKLPTGTGDPDAASVVIVDKQHHKTHVLQMVNGQLEDVLTVPDSVGKKSTPTPEGRWTVS